MPTMLFMDAGIGNIHSNVKPEREIGLASAAKVVRSLQMTALLLVRDLTAISPNGQV